MIRPKLIFQKTDRCPGFIKLPEYKTAKAAAFDLQSPIYATIPARSRIIINIELRVLIPAGYKVEFKSRSGLSAKLGVEKGAGLIDEDFRDSLMVILYNHSDKAVEIDEGDRVAQAELVEYTQGNIEWGVVPLVDEESDRRGGLGSTGK